jgi:hypothetical protein
MMNQPLAVHISSAAIALTSVPMIPGSGVLEFRASTMISLEFGIVVDRDQIQARNMPELITKIKSSQYSQLPAENTTLTLKIKLCVGKQYNSICFSNVEVLFCSLSHVSSLRRS